MDLFLVKKMGKWVLRGVVSWGHNNCKTGYFSVFARVSYFLKWIETNKAGLVKGETKDMFI